MKQCLFLGTAMLGMLAVYGGTSWAQQEHDDSQQHDRTRSSQDQSERVSRSDQQRQSRRQEAQREGSQRDRDLGELKNEAEKFIRRYDKNQDQQLARDELPRHLRERFHDIDRDGNESLTQSELERHARAMQRYIAMPVEVTYIWVTGANRGWMDTDDLQDAYSLLRRIDQNDDGRLSRAELMRQQRRAALQCVDCIIDRCDEDDDGQLTRNEVRGTAIAYDFSSVDRNEDGTLTRSELQRAAERQEEDEDGESETAESQREERRR